VSLNTKAILRILCALMIILGVAMIPSVGLAVYYKEQSTIPAFLAAIIPLMAAGIWGVIKVRPESNKLRTREGFLIVSLTWIFASLVGTVPYLVTGILPSFADAFFESTAGFTTTGATIIADVEILPRSILFWRSFTQWLGGMGILVFAISILPRLGISGVHILKAETSAPMMKKMASRVADSAKILYIMYIIFTLAAIVLYRAGGMGFFDSAIASFANVATGGLSNYNDGLMHFGSVYVEVISAVFAVLVAINFSLYHNLTRGQIREFLKDQELRTFFFILIAAILIISVDLWMTQTYSTFEESLRYGGFQAASFLTTTGHFSTDFGAWPAFSQMILFVLMLIGACSSSTGCGIKVIRVIILFKIIRKSFYKMIHPRAIRPTKLNGRVVPQDVITNIASYFYLYISIVVLSIFIISFENFDLLTTVSSVVACLNNIGTGFGLVGPTGNFSIFSDFSKFYLSFLMIVGRLELFTVILLFFPGFWNPDK